MPLSPKDPNVRRTDWEPIIDVCFPKELYAKVLIEEAERELLEHARHMTRELFGRHLVEH
jgi:hypothetical protein